MSTTPESGWVPGAAQICGSFTIEQMNPALRDAILGAPPTRHEVMATFADGTKAYGWMRGDDVEVSDGLARADIHITRMVDPDGTVHDFPEGWA